MGTNAEGVPLAECWGYKCGVLSLKGGSVLLCFALAVVDVAEAAVWWSVFQESLIIGGPSSVSRSIPGPIYTGKFISK
jgi:hypothetical protein